MESEFCVVLVTAPNLNEGRNIARKLVEEKLAACVNLIPQIESFYWWDGKFEDTEEVLLVAKTVRKQMDKVEAAVKANHSYIIPEVIALPISDGSAPYLNWLKENVQ